MLDCNAVERDLVAPFALARGSLAKHGRLPLVLISLGPQTRRGQEKEHWLGRASSGSDITIPKTYVICELDQIFPVPLQEMLVKSTPGLKEARIHASHGPFMSQPQPLTELIVKIVARE
ncbi:hypothetical protein QBC46DRAFT_442751 [Diplogelasinospora grovesii]|uniref:Uncharacterized protein n=1 Tax=Diplogelasinospora grovesii TaxID=303347 RepID=A0AAN6N238_9PEZI|nr:hypothetical protein QBC46DRAFT_442751 [Diplogelasinospora grovesii]